MVGRHFYYEWIRYSEQHHLLSNLSRDSGGGIFVYDGPLEVQNSTSLTTMRITKGWWFLIDSGSVMVSNYYFLQQ